jgi:hypothetical protein
MELSREDGSLQKRPYKGHLYWQVELLFFLSSLDLVGSLNAPI